MIDNFRNIDYIIQIYLNFINGNVKFVIIENDLVLVLFIVIYYFLLSVFVLIVNRFIYFKEVEKNKK